MGQATVDLPDSSSNPPVPEASTNAAPGASADDLLSQLAGEEIDRMLSAADADTAAGLISEPAEPTEPTSPVNASTSTLAPMEAELNELLSQFTDQTPDPAEPQTTTEAVSEITPLAARQETAAATFETPADATGPAERAALEVADTSTQSLNDLAAEAPDEMPLPIYFRPLEWINAPLAMFPETVRNLLGMIGVLTTINAAAVLLYVIIFRHHPHS
jgi:hypothetical protein